MYYNKTVWNMQEFQPDFVLHYTSVVALHVWMLLL